MLNLVKKGINDIFTGFSKWAARYISACKNQPEVQQARAAKWSAILQGKLDILNQSC